MNRSGTASAPQRAALRMPISASPSPIGTPQLRLTMSWDSNTADPLGRIVHRYGRAVQVAPPGKPQQPIAQILTIEQDHDHEHDNQSRRCQGVAAAAR
jgi:hypothetical protein